MSLFTPFIRAAAAGAAMETGREAVRRRNGLGFAAGDYWDFDTNYDYGNNWDWWFGGGGGDSYNDYDFLMIEGGDDWPMLGPIPMPEMGPAPTTGWWQDWYDLLSQETISHPDFDAFAQTQVQQPSYRDITGDLDYRPNFWDWLSDFGPGPAQLDPQYGPAGDGSLLPGYCPKGTYHPVNDPFACVPFPPSDPNAKKPAAQKKAEQAAMNAAKKIQQAADKGCPKDPQGRPVWRNPQTNKCELKPPCGTGLKFDSTTRRCLTPAEVKELYGDNNWLIWALIALGVIVVVKGSGGSGGRRRR